MTFTISLTANKSSFSIEDLPSTSSSAIIIAELIQSLEHVITHPGTICTSLPIHFLLIHAPKPLTNTASIILSLYKNLLDTINQNELSLEQTTSILKIHKSVRSIIEDLDNPVKDIIHQRIPSKNTIYSSYAQASPLILSDITKKTSASLLFYPIDSLPSTSAEETVMSSEITFPDITIPAVPTSLWLEEELFPVDLLPSVDLSTIAAPSLDLEAYLLDDDLLLMEDPVHPEEPCTIEGPLLPEHSFKSSPAKSHSYNPTSSPLYYSSSNKESNLQDNDNLPIDHSFPPSPLNSEQALKTLTADDLLASDAEDSIRTESPKEIDVSAITPKLSLKKRSKRKSHQPSTSSDFTLQQSSDEDIEKTLPPAKRARTLSVSSNTSTPPITSTEPTTSIEQMTVIEKFLQKSPLWGPIPVYAIYDRSPKNPSIKSYLCLPYQREHRPASKQPTFILLEVANQKINLLMKKIKTILSTPLGLRCISLPDELKTLEPFQSSSSILQTDPLFYWLLACILAYNKETISFFFDTHIEFYKPRFPGNLEIIKNAHKERLKKIDNAIAECKTTHKQIWPHEPWLIFPKNPLITDTPSCIHCQTLKHPEASSSKSTSITPFPVKLSPRLKQKIIKQLQGKKPETTLFPSVHERQSAQSIKAFTIDTHSAVPKIKTLHPVPTIRSRPHPHTLYASNLEAAFRSICQTMKTIKRLYLNPQQGAVHSLKILPELTPKGVLTSKVLQHTDPLLPWVLVNLLRYSQESMNNFYETHKDLAYRTIPKTHENRNKKIDAFVVQCYEKYPHLKEDQQLKCKPNPLIKQQAVASISKKKYKSSKKTATLSVKKL